MYTKIWNVMDVNYKIGKNSLHSFFTENELRGFLIEELNIYNSYLTVDYENTVGDIETLIKYTISLGEAMFNLYECGVIAVNMFDFETQNLVKYE